MNRKLFTAGLTASAVLAICSASASATVIGGSSQSSDQGVNETQLANGGTATGNVIVVGTPATAGAGTQSSTNVLSDGQSVGPPGGGGVFIAPSGSGPTQSSHQGVNGTQISSNGAIGLLQDSTNVLGNTQIVGGDLSCVGAVPACTSSVIIGTPTQANQQGVNGLQSADGGVTTGDSISTPAVVLNGLAFTPDQFSLNDVENGQLVLG